MDIVLIAGLWLDSSAWDTVAAELEARGHRPRPVALPGQGDGRADATLADQLAAVLSAVDEAGTPPLVVGHSAACGLAWLAADARPDRIARVAMIGGFPSEDGDAYADFFEPRDGVMAFPGWEKFEGPDSVDLDAATRAEMEASMIPVPTGVTRGVVHLSDPRRYDVPLTLVCPEFTPEEVRAWVEDGDLPELDKAAHVDYVDLDTGHWPMVSAPAELARVLVSLT